MVGLLAISCGVPTNVTVTAMLLAPLLAEHLPGWMNARAREHVHIVEADGPCHYLQRLATLHTPLIQAAAGSDRYELRRSAEVGHNLLRGAASLLQAQDTRSASARLIAYERRTLQLAHHVAQMRPALEHGAASTEQTREPGPQLGPYPPGVRPTTPPTPHRVPGAPPWKAPSSCLSATPARPATRTCTCSSRTRRTTSAPEPRRSTPPPSPPALCSTRRCVSPTAPGSTTSLSEDGSRARSFPCRPSPTNWAAGPTGRPSATGRASPPTWCSFVHAGNCDALSLGLPEIVRALVCTGPVSHVRAFDGAADEFIDYGPEARAAALAEVGTLLASLVAEQELWLGDGLLAPLTRRP